MMGAIRRLYDQIVAGTLALPYLPLAGGTVTGNVAINGTGGVTLSGVQLRNISNALEVYHASAGGVASRGPAAGYTFGDRDQASAQWTWYAIGGLSYLNNAGTGNVLNVTGTGRMALAGAIDTPQHLISGTMFAQRVDNAHQIYDATGNLALALYVGNNYYRADAHTWQNDAGGNIATLSSGGALSVASLSVGGAFAAANASVSGTVQANQLTSNANIDAVGTITGASLVSTGNISAGNALFVSSAGDIVNIYDRGGSNITLYAAAATNYYDNNTHYLRNRGGSTSYFLANASGTYNQNGSWGVISDDSLKQNVQPYTAGLTQIRQLNPVSFEYTSGAAFRSEGTINYGLLASEVQPVVPEMVGQAEFDVGGSPVSTQTLLPTHLVYLLLNSVKELAARVEALETQGG